MANLYGNICTCTRCNGVVHTIRRGDTLYLLSRHYNVSVNDIMNANRNVNIYNLRIGDEICIPVRRMMDARMNMDNQEEMHEEMIEEMREEIREELRNNMMNPMSAESIEAANIDDNRDMNNMMNRKLSEVLNMDMTLGEFAKMLKDLINKM